jgi:hypothetical protein
MFRIVRLNTRCIPLRLKPHEAPEYNIDFERYPFSNSHMPMVGYWKIKHGFDYGAEQMDYEDHSVHMLHQRPTHWRSYGVVVVGIASLCFWYYTWVEAPFSGILWGQSYMDLQMNGIKFLNNDEEYHNWDKLKKEYLASIAEPEEEEEEETVEEETAEEETAEEEQAPEETETNETEQTEESENNTSGNDPVEEEE